jgi:hypothetical protein
MKSFAPDILREYHSVPVSTTQTYDYVIPNGKTVEISIIQLDCCSSTSAQVIWDPTGVNKILAYTVRDAQHHMTCTFVGDGSKKLRLSIKNTDTVSAHTVGGAIQGFEYDS